MRVLIGCDVDPVLPARLERWIGDSVWSPLDEIPRLVERLRDGLPPITWLIRSDESVRFATGEFASGYILREALWKTLASRGHQLGWHMHVMTFSEPDGEFVFDPLPGWLQQAHDALANYFPVRVTRTGWDYANAQLFQELERLGIRLDFSALPGNVVWLRMGPSRLVVDWLRCPDDPYRPDRKDHQRPGSDSLALVEVPVTQFRNAPAQAVKRMAWRLRNGCLSTRGLTRKTRLLTDHWDSLPERSDGICALFFHPEDLQRDGLECFVNNVARLRSQAKAEFITADEALRLCSERLDPVATAR
jgi:hypothetical protein